MITTKAEISIHRLKSGFVAIAGDDMRAYSTGHDLLEGLREILDVPAKIDATPVVCHVERIKFTGADGRMYEYPGDDDVEAAANPEHSKATIAKLVPSTTIATPAKLNSEIQKAERDGPVELANLVKLEGGDDAWVRLPFNVLETALGTTAPTVTKWIDEARDRNLIRVYRVYRGEGIGNWFSIHPNHGGKAPEYEAWAGIELKDEPEKPAETAKPTEMMPDAIAVMCGLRDFAIEYGKSSFKAKLSALATRTDVRLRDIPGILELLQARGMIGFSPSSGGAYAFTVKEKETA